MASTLQAGAAVVNIIGQDNQFQNAINQSTKSVKNFQQNLNGITKMPGLQGGLAVWRDVSMAAVATGTIIRNSVINPLKSAVLEFANFGDSVAKMGKRVGMDAQDISRLGFAAEQSGANLESLGGGMRVLLKNMAAADKGDKGVLQTFQELGVDFEKLKTLSKTDQFLTLADAVGNLGDEAKQTDAAMKLFGKGGTALLPMFQSGEKGIRELMQEADTNGISISNEDAGKAEVLNDSLNRIKRSLQGMRMAIVTGLSEPIVKLLDYGTKVAQWLREFINNNRSFVNTLISVGAGFTSTLSAMMGWSMIAPMFSGIGTSLMSIGGYLLRIIPFIINFTTPWGLVRTAIIGAIGALAYFQNTGSGLLSWLGGFASKVQSVFMSVFGDAVSLIQQGKITKAVQLLWLNIQLIFEQGKLAVINKFNEVTAAVIEPFNAIYEAVSGVLTPLWNWISETASSTSNYLYNIWSEKMGWLGDLFSTWWTYIGEGWDALMHDTGEVIVGVWWGIASGINSAIATIRQTWNSLLTGIQKTWLNASSIISKGIGYIIAKLQGLDPNEVMKAIEEDYNFKIKGVEDRSADKSAQIEQGRQDWQKYFDEMASNSLARLEKAKNNAPQTNDRIEQLKNDIAVLKAFDRDGSNDPKTDQAIKEIKTTALQTMLAPEVNTQPEKNLESESEQKVRAVVQGVSGNKFDLLGGALNSMKSEKEFKKIETNTQRTAKGVEALTDAVKNNSAMTYT